VVCVPLADAAGGAGGAAGSGSTAAAGVSSVAAVSGMAGSAGVATDEVVVSSAAIGEPTPVDVGFIVVSSFGSIYITPLRPAMQDFGGAGPLYVPLSEIVNTHHITLLIRSSKAFLPANPICLPSSLPPLNKIVVGMDITPYFPAVC